MKRLYFEKAPIFWKSANILCMCWYFRQAPIFYDFASLFCLIFVAANICVYFQYLFMHFVCANIFGAIVLKPRFKIDVVVEVIWSIVIIINSVLTLQVSTASLPHDREPCEIKVVSNHTCSLHTCVCAGSRMERVCLSGLINGRNQFNSWGFPQVPHSSPGLYWTPPNILIMLLKLWSFRLTLYECRLCCGYNALTKLTFKNNQCYTH